MADERKPLYHYYAPRYWIPWLGILLLRIVCLLPHRVALAIGRLAGTLVFHLGGSRRAIVRRNIELCFPKLSAEEREALTRAHFKALGMMLVETGLGRWASDKHIRTLLADIKGLHHLTDALDRGQGVIMLCAHLTTLELSGRFIKTEIPPLDAVYRKNKSDFITEIQRTGRERAARQTIEKRDIKRMVKSLREGHPVWYAPDQSFSRKGAEVIKFFGVPSMHTTATSTLARLGRAAVIPFFPRRLPDNRYEVVILPPLDVPSGDPVNDTEQYAKVLEDFVRSCPEQYFWIHRKFKDLPDGYPDYYAELDALK